MDKVSKPEWAGQYGVTYEDIVRSWGYEVEAFETFGSYQGDHLVLIRDGERAGFIVFGYGSCSGCDELDACQPWDEDGDWSGVVNLADELRGQIHWEDSPSALAEWMASNPENHWWNYDDDCKAWVNAYVWSPTENS